jgi:hypothetical protein
VALNIAGMSSTERNGNLRDSLAPSMLITPRLNSPFPSPLLSLLNPRLFRSRQHSTQPPPRKRPTFQLHQHPPNLLRITPRGLLIPRHLPSNVISQLLEILIRQCPPLARCNISRFLRLNSRFLSSSVANALPKASIAGAMAR